MTKDSELDGRRKKEGGKRRGGRKRKGGGRRRLREERMQAPFARGGAGGRSPLRKIRSGDIVL
jgi:hypothetical protein